MMMELKQLNLQTVKRMKIQSLKNEVEDVAVATDEAIKAQAEVKRIKLPLVGMESFIATLARRSKREF